MSGGSRPLIGEVIVRAIRGGPRPALLLAYSALSTVVALDPQAGWTFVVFGPPLVLIAWLDAIGKCPILLTASCSRGNASAKTFDLPTCYQGAVGVRSTAVGQLNVLSEEGRRRCSATAGERKTEHRRRQQSSSVAARVP